MIIPIVRYSFSLPAFDDQVFCSEPARVKFPLYNEKDQCIIFDAGLLDKIKRQMIIRIHFNNIIYVFESDLGTLKKLSDGHRHRV